MESRFKVVMKKDDEVMKDFISFTYRAQGQAGRMKARVLALGLVIIGFLAGRNENLTAGIIIGSAGILFLFFTLFLQQISVVKLKKADIAYKNGTELTYAFTNGGIYVYENGEQVQHVGGYSSVTCFYGDEKNYYVGVNNDDLYLLPKKCFVEGEPEEFLAFIEGKGNEAYEFLPAEAKNRWMVYKAKQQVKDAEYNAKAAEARAKAKAKKDARKNR